MSVFAKKDAPTKALLLSIEHYHELFGTLWLLRKLSIYPNAYDNYRKPDIRQAGREEKGESFIGGMEKVMTVMVIAFFVTAIVAVNETDFRQAKGKEKQKSKGG